MPNDVSIQLFKLLTLDNRTFVKASLIPLLILLLILFIGCAYYLRISRLSLMEAVKILFYGPPLELRDKSEKELYKLLSINISLEEFEKCAEIRDELKRRKEMEVGA